MGSNFIQYVPPAVMTSVVVPALTQLVLIDNKITFLEAGTFSNLTTLRRLYVHHPTRVHPNMCIIFFK